MRLLLLFMALTVLGACNSAGSGAERKSQLVVFSAGSLLIPFNDLEQGFENSYPSIDVLSEYHGSIQVMRHVSELHEPIDVVATADASLIPMLMYGTVDPDTGMPYAQWYINFGSNRLAIAMQPDSKYHDEISEDNWYDTLSRPDVKVGIADPRFDASGYRALMTFSLAQKYSQDASIFKKMFQGDFNYPINFFTENGFTTITVPEILETKQGSHIVIRGSSIELIALLESGDLDYAFEYESVIDQHHLEKVRLPDALNLGSEEWVKEYQSVEVVLDFQRFASVKPVFKGDLIGYGITIPSNAPHPREAELFIKYFLGDDGRRIMSANSHPITSQVTCFDTEHIPGTLLGFCDAE